VATADLAEAMLSEAAHSCYQGAMRSDARTVEVVDGRTLARPAHIWLPYANGKLRPWLDHVMPRVKWAKWQGKYITEVETKQGTLQGHIQEAVAGLPEEIEKVSIKTMWTLNPAFATFPQRTRNDALANLLDDPFEPLQWVREGRSLIRDRMFQPA
jgi:hypothetical protein